MRQIEGLTLRNIQSNADDGGPIGAGANLRVIKTRAELPIDLSVPLGNASHLVAAYITYINKYA